jgi:hypothetical protein
MPYFNVMLYGLLFAFELGLPWMVHPLAQLRCTRTFVGDGKVARCLTSFNHWTLSH